MVDIEPHPLRTVGPQAGVSILGVGVLPPVDDGDPTQRTGPRRVYGGVAGSGSAGLAATLDPLAGLIGRTLGGRYEIDAVIGRRSLGTAYRAIDQAWPAAGASRRRVTLTVLDPPVGDDPDAIAQLLRVATRVRDLAHPALDAVIDVVRDAGRIVAVSEHRVGRTLSSLLGTGPGAGWPLRVVLPIGHRIADGVAQAHLAGLAHGGLGLDTVVLTANEEVVVLDLGLAGTWATGEKSRTDPRDDLVSLARIVVSLLSGGPIRSIVREDCTRPAGLGDAAWQALRQGLAGRYAAPGDLVAMMVSLEDPGWLGRLVGRRPR